MPGLLPQIDPNGLLEFSVVYTDRALNHMSKQFQGVMKDISGILKEVYRAKSVVISSGTFMRGRLHVRLQNQAGGRMGDTISTLSDSLRVLRFEV